MSNAIRYDALLVRDLARELHHVLAGARLEAAFLDRDSLRVTLRTRSRRRGQRGAPSTPAAAEPVSPSNTAGPTDPASPTDPSERASPSEPPDLLWELHPESGRLTTTAPVDGSGGRVQLATPTFIAAVHAPPDERVLIIDLDAPDAPASAARRIIIELVTNQWNAVAVGSDGRITAVLRERSARGLRAGGVYELPSRSQRLGADAPVASADWHAALAVVPPGERLAALQQRIAFTSPINAAWIIGDADVTSDASALDRALDRYRALVWRDDPSPSVITERGTRSNTTHRQPYPRREPAGDRNAEPAASLLDAFARAAVAAPGEEPAVRDDLVVDRALGDIALRLEAIERRTHRLGEEQDGATTDALRMRRDADLLLAQLHRVERGASSVELDDFNGGTAVVELDPALNASDNAKRLYDAARKRDRAAHRIPALLREVAQERDRLEHLAERVRAGTATADELTRIRPPTGARVRPGSRGRDRDRDARPLPYREYRTTGGHEIRVGRSPKANDELTFRQSAPTDIWLHARDVAGAHVILRWNRADENPPAAAIAEAAVLAALHSRARTSRVVAVDWTRRRHVRKPRRAAPGLVVPDRVKTVFVEPDASAEERMRVR